MHSRAPAAAQGGRGGGRGLASVRWRQRTPGGIGAQAASTAAHGANVDTPAPRRRTAVAHALDMTRGIGTEAAIALPAAFRSASGADAPQRVVNEVLSFLKARCGSGAVPGRVPRIILESPGGFASLTSTPTDAAAEWVRIERAWIMV